MCCENSEEGDQLELKGLESESYNSGEDYRNDREFRDDDEDDDDLSYVETGRSLAMFNITEPAPHDTLPVDVNNFNYGVSDDSDEEKEYMALRSLVLYGTKSACFFSLSDIMSTFLGN